MNLPNGTPNQQTMKRQTNKQKYVSFIPFEKDRGVYLAKMFCSLYHLTMTMTTKMMMLTIKLFTRILQKRMERFLDENQPREQAGFRKGYSTVDHLQTIGLIN